MIFCSIVLLLNLYNYSHYCKLLSIKQLIAYRYIICRNKTTIKYQINDKTKSRKVVKSVEKMKENDKKVDKSLITTDDNGLRFNRLGIQMISKNLHKRIFGDCVPTDEKCDKKLITAIVRQLNNQGFKGHDIKSNQQLNDIQIDKYLPQFLSNDLSKHYHLLGQQFSQKYKQLSDDLINAKVIDMPKEWVLDEGWTRYTNDSNGNITHQRVDFPLENDLVFDVEVCMKDSNGQRPTLATAMSSKAWYSWCSSRLIESKNNDKRFDTKLIMNDMIPMGFANNEEKLIIGHNVSFDRSFIREQYDIKCDKTRFLDTLSLHMCISGLTQHQRALSYSRKIGTTGNISGDIDPHLWDGIGSLNNLVDVFHLYCGDDTQQISKDPRNIFIKGSIGDVFESFQQLMTYCANDVLVTHKIFKTIYPMFLERFPNPITFAGMLEMSVMYLPVNTYNWNRYVSECNAIYDDHERELNLSLREIANDCCSLAIDNQYTSDVWLWDLNWETQQIRFKKTKPEITNKRMTKNCGCDPNSIIDLKDDNINENVSKIMSTGSLLKKVQPLMPGYPKWYLEFCAKFKYDFDANGDVSPEDLEWESGPYKISTQMRSVPKLMRLLWNGYPLHFDEKHGWGYITPDITANDCSDRVEGGIDDNKNTLYFPMKEFRKLIKNRQKQFKKLNFNESLEEIETYNESKGETIKAYDDVIKGCLFYKLPHKGGPDKRVGNPLSKDFLKKVEDGSLTSLDTQMTNSVLNHSKRLSYWKNASKRICSQIVVTSDDSSSGAILPRVIVAGTVTRRAVEPTWLTASNAVSDRLGSELKSMIQCPQGYHYVGADVDSQELWIASLIGDSYYSGIHGSTGIGWMTLEGNKANGTDMHSKTAASINITRDEAKVLNYARIYGSGQPFASRFLMQSNPSLTHTEAKEKAKKIFIETKGKRRTIKSKVENRNENEDNKDVTRRQWFGGSESHMFNKLEEIAESYEPKTPVLECRISRCLEPKVVKHNYITSRVNWVVQSSAVDFLHIMLVTMKWLFKEMQIEGRFSISIHDELRYLVKSEHKYKAALALQLSNLLTRSLFAYKMGLNDLPLSVAFFSNVDIDKCLRKEVNTDSKTPSNPLGLHKGYGIPFGEALDIVNLINKIDF
ncbi:DNA polymerase subunit gamma-1-like [Oppia nitens]|uniref:DNA polymerase subunit gamma-1-like n=1 Tax=Oppia nitens TaxID=1686743 RepID=UPI0023DA5A5A|nr:DNA polymerase subunit gamma-1-like [Oppia nitens]